MPSCRCWRRSKRSRSRLHGSSQAKVRSTRLQRLHGGVEQACASALRGLAVAGILFEVGLQAGSADALPMVRGITTTSEVKGGSTEIYPMHIKLRLSSWVYSIE
jgi:hypothetical protein